MSGKKAPPEEERKKYHVMVLDVLKQITVEPYLFFCFFGQVVRLVTFQSLLMDSACRNWHVYDADICNDLDNHRLEQENSVEAGNNLYSMVMLLSSLPAVVVAVFLGPWSDKYSRKYPLMISASGLFLEASFSAGLSFYPEVSPVWYIVVSVFGGVSGGFIMCISSSFSYISDVSDERSRSARYAFLEFSTIFALVLGTIIGGQLFAVTGYGPVMTLSPVSFLIAILYTAFVVKETKTRPTGQRWSDMMKDLVTVDNLRESYRTCSRRRPGNIRLQIWLLVWVSCCQKFLDLGTLAISFPYTRGMYKWDVADFSTASTAFYVVNGFCVVAIIPLLANKMRLHEAALGLVGMLSLTAKMVITSVATYEPLFYFAWMSGALNNCAGIAVRARISKLVNRDEMGRAFSLVGTCESVTPLLGTLVFVQVYNASLNVFPGLAFAASAVFLIPCVIIFYWMMGLPTVSLGEYAKDDSTVVASPLETFSTNYTTLKEESL